MPGPRRSPAAKTPLTPFLAAVRRTILRIPRGETMSYGMVALASGVPNGARAVARALHVIDDVPWWRVCRAGGSFAPQTMPLQEELLRQEGWLPAQKVRAPRESAKRAANERSAKRASAKRAAPRNKSASRAKKSS